MAWKLPLRTSSENPGRAQPSCWAEGTRVGFRGTQDTEDQKEGSRAGADWGSLESVPEWPVSYESLHACEGSPLDQGKNHPGG